MRLILCPLFALLLVGCAVSHEAKPREAKSSAAVTATRPLPPGTRLKVRTTAYTQTEPGGWANAVGGRLRYNMTNSSAASDWSWLPVGTRFRMLCTGRVHVIEDYGSALVGRYTIDIYKSTRAAMNKWGVRYVHIDILQMGSYPVSLAVLKPRQKWPHVRRMVVELQKKVR